MAFYNGNKKNFVAKINRSSHNFSEATFLRQYLGWAKSFKLYLLTQTILNSEIPDLSSKMTNWSTFSFFFRRKPKVGWIKPRFSMDQFPALKENFFVSKIQILNSVFFRTNKAVFYFRKTPLFWVRQGSSACGTQTSLYIILQENYRKELPENLRVK